jgi:hypothetical protein
MELAMEPILPNELAFKTGPNHVLTCSIMSGYTCQRKRCENGLILIIDFIRQAVGLVLVLVVL